MVIRRYCREKQMKMLHLNLTYQWFDAIKKGLKTTEYREDKRFWRKRLSDYRPGDKIVFHRSYTNTTIQGTIKNIYLISSKDLPELESKFFNGKETQFFAIDFILDNGETNDKN